MNNNRLTKLTAFEISELLEHRSDIKIKEIGLKWNQIDAEGGVRIATALSGNKELKVLDLSWNNIGVKRSNTIDGHIGSTWGKALRENATLVHLDLSFNKIGFEET